MTQKKLSICHVITRMVIGGAQENTLLTVQGLHKKGHRCVLVTGPSPGPEGELLKTSDIEGLEIVEIPSLIRSINPVKDAMAYFQLKKYFQQEQFDIVHTHASKAGILGRLAADAAKVPCIMHTVHGQAFHKYQSAWKNKIYITAEKIAAKHSHRILAVAQAMIDQCVEAGVAPREMYNVVYSGMDISAFLEAKPEEDLRKKLGIPEGVPVVGKVARLFELKGHDYLLEAAKKVVAKVPEVRFLLVGDGLLREEIQRQITINGLQKNFVFSGLVPPDEVCRYTALMDILVHLSLREGLPRTVVQGLASGIPAVGFDLDGTPEVVIDDETGYICEPGNVDQVADYLIKLLLDDELRNRLGSQGRDRVKEQFSTQRMVDCIEKEYFQYFR